MMIVRISRLSILGIRRHPSIALSDWGRYYFGTVENVQADVTVSKLSFPMQIGRDSVKLSRNEQYENSILYTIKVAR